MVSDRAAGILLTGGSSRRMGFDKATLRVGGMGMAERIGDLLATQTDPAIEVGPGRSALPFVTEPTPGQGPLVAVAAAAAELARLRWQGPAIVLACDLPLLSAAALELLATWPGDGSVVPVVDGRRQPLCARWSAIDLQGAVDRAGAGHRSLGGLPEVGPGTELTEAQWSVVTDGSAFRDVDSPADIVQLRLGGPLATSPAPSVRRTSDMGGVRSNGSPEPGVGSGREVSPW